MTRFTLEAQWQDQQITLEVPAWNFPLRPLRLRVNGIERLAWRGYVTRRKTLTLAPDAQLQVELSAHGLRHSAVLRLNDVQIAAGCGPAVPPGLWLRYGAALTVVFGTAFGGLRYACSDATALAALVQGGAAGLLFAAGVMLADHLHARRHSRQT